MALAEQIYDPKNLEAHIGGVSFFGWNKDESLYAVRVFRGLAMGELGGDEAASLIEVYDPRTDRLVALFRFASAFKDAEKDAAIRKSWAAAKPKDQWAAFAKEHGFELEPAKSVIPEGWTVKAKAAGKLAKVGKLKVGAGSMPADGGVGLEMTWDFFAKQSDLETFTAQQGSDNPAGSPYDENPLVQLSFEKGGTEWPALLMKLPYTANDMSEGPPQIVGYLHFFPSKSGRRVAIIGAWIGVGVHEEMGTDSKGTFYSRSLGPQSKIVGSADTAARALAALDGLGLAVTQLEIKDDGGDKSGVYYRGSETKPIADKLARALGVEASELKKAGWLQLIIVAGKSTGTPPR